MTKKQANQKHLFTRKELGEKDNMQKFPRLYEAKAYALDAFTKAFMLLNLTEEEAKEQAEKIVNAEDNDAPR